MSLLSTALCLLAVATIGSSAGIPLNKDGHEFTLDDVLSFHQKKAESVDIDTSSIDPSIKEDAKLSVPELIVKYGYGVEVHHLVTKDGYTLEVHRVTSSPKRNVSLADKPPVFLMHGLSGASSSYVLMGPHNGLAYLLADEGYDVWMGNARGNRYSRKHNVYDPDGDRTDRRNFFDFSWHQTGSIDLPAIVDLILANSQFKKMHYVGHSQGTTVFFVMNSLYPEYNEKFISMHALAPVAFWNNQDHPIVTTLASQWNILLTLFRTLGIYEFMFDGNELSDVNLDLPPLRESNPAQHNESMQIVIDGHNPAGTATNNVGHYGQNIASGHFRQFDHGRLLNIVRYGTAQPPDYDLDKVTAPIALHYSLNDWLVHPADVLKLFKLLPNPIGMIQIPDPLFTHGDFIFAIDTRPLVYYPMLDIMREFESKQ